MYRVHPRACTLSTQKTGLLLMNAPDNKNKVAYQQYIQTFTK